MSLDQEKAFDRVGFMVRTMTKMGFSSSLCRTFYSARWSSVLVNGHFSDFFLLTQGVRQGCPLSPLLYIICAEVLAANVRCCPSIDGLVLPGSDKVFQITQYADDTTIIVTSEMSFRAIIKLYELYKKLLGQALTRPNPRDFGFVVGLAVQTGLFLCSGLRNIYTVFGSLLALLSLSRPIGVLGSKRSPNTSIFGSRGVSP